MLPARAPERQDVTAIAHRYRQPDRLLAVMASRSSAAIHAQRRHQEEEAMKISRRDTLVAKADFEMHSRKLSQAWTLTKEALAA